MRDLRYSVRGCWKRPELRVTGGAYVMAAVWLLVVPVQWLAAAMLAAAVHETGHLLCLRLCGRKVWRIAIGALGARMETEPMEPGDEVLCALAGPAAGLLLCLWWRKIPMTALCALVQSLFNLLPVYPLDGGRAIHALRKIRSQGRIP